MTRLVVGGDTHLPPFAPVHVIILHKTQLGALVRQAVAVSANH